MKPVSPSQSALHDDEIDPPASLQHTGQQPFRRPPEEDPERVGEGELDIGKPSNERSARDRAWEGEDDEDVAGSDVDDD